MTPDWLFQVMWWGAGVGGSGAFWYFLAQQGYRAALWTAFATIVVVLLSVALYIQNNLLQSKQQIAANLPAAVIPSVPQRPEESKADPQEKIPSGKEPLIAPHPPASTALDVDAEQVLSNPTPDRPTIPERSAAEIFGNLRGITLPSQFRQRVEALYIGRWTREPGWQAKVHDLPITLLGGQWHCSFKEVGSDTLIMATTLQDISMFRRGDSVTVSGKITDVRQMNINYINLDDAIIQGENIP